MKRLFALTASLLALCSLSAQTLRQMTIEEGGTGPYKAVMTSESGFENYTFYRPADMAAAVEKEGKLPVLLFGNGGCASTSIGFENYLTEIASHGYIVIAVGPYQEPGQKVEQEWFWSPEGEDKPDMPVQKVAALDLHAQLDKLAAESKKSGSIFFGMADTDNVCAIGQSCGGSQALVIGTAGDERIRTIIPLNSGCTRPGDFLSDVVNKDDLVRLSGPIAYLIGGPTDIAYKNAESDYAVITTQPVVFANTDLGHGGSYTQPHGGTFAELTLLWLDWQLKGNASGKGVFLGEPSAQFADWTFQYKNF